MMYYILNKDKTIRKEPDLMEWAVWMGTDDRIVARDVVDDVRISTVFLGIDHSFLPGPPVLFETMIFGGEHDSDMYRYCTYEEALEGHKKAVLLVKKS